MLIARYASTAGTPPAVAHSSGATWASEVFSATDSSAARVRPAPSSRAGSRPHSDGSSRRAASMSSRSSSRDISRPVRANDVPPRHIQVAVAVAATRQSRPPARNGRAQQGHRTDHQAHVQRAGNLGVAVGDALQPGGRLAEQRDRMPPFRVAQREVGQVPGQHADDADLPCRRKHSRSVSYVVYSNA